MIVGIDLGTSTSEVAFLKNGKPQMIREVSGSERGVLPSVVGLNSKGSIRVGQDAVALLAKGFGVQEAKRLMGSDTKISLGGETYSPQEISAFILKHLKEEAERYLGEPISEVVITVPAYFDDAQRQATKDAGELAGLRVRRLINEPTAAALAYGLERPGVEEKILVYDLGGGTLDVTVLELSEGCLDVFASTGNNKLGGKDFDEVVMQFIAKECRTATGISLETSPRFRPRLKASAKRAKEMLSSASTTTVVLDNLGLKPDGDPIDFELEIDQSRFEALIRPLVESTRVQLDEALAAKSVAPSDIKTILLVGGSTRIPFVRKFIADYFGGTKIRSDVSADEAVSLGAAILGGILDEKIDSETVVITDVSPFTLGVAVRREVSGERISGFFDPLIEKQSTIPRTAKETYTTSYDWQDAIRVEVYQGENQFCKDNLPIADFMHAVKPAPAGKEVEIEISYDLSGNVEIVARDPETGIETRKEVRVGAGRMSDEERSVSRARLERQWAQGKSTSEGGKAQPSHEAPRAARMDTWKQSPLYPKVSALMTHAERQLNALPTVSQTAVAKLLADMRSALDAANEGALSLAEGRLTDLLFDLG